MYGAAVRGRYMNDRIIQQLEVNGEEFCNAITTVQKDSLAILGSDIYR